MFKNIRNGLVKLFGGNKWVILLVVLVLAFALYTYSSSKALNLDSMSDGNVNSPPSPESTSEKPVITPSPASTSSSGYALQPVANPAELLPKDVNSEWSRLNPVGTGDIQTPDLLQSGYHIGIDTIGQTLKNPSYDLRSDPIIEKKNVGPWNQSTIESDLARVPLEVGYGLR